MQDPNFVSVVAFSYCDGPEQGLALFASGQGVRFTTLGDSNSRMFRAFELTAIAGDWWESVKHVSKLEERSSSSRVFVPGKVSEALNLLMQEVQRAPAIAQYIAVGKPDLSRVLVTPVAAAQLRQLREVESPTDAFDLAHRLVKEQGLGRVKA